MRSSAAWPRRSTSLSVPADDPRLIERKKEIESLASRAASQPAQVKQIAHWADELLAAGLNAKGGILVAGTVTGVGVQNGIYGAAVRMNGLPKPVVVLSRQSLALAKDDKVVILGQDCGQPGEESAGLPRDASGGDLGRLGDQAAVRVHHRARALAFFPKNG